MQINVVVPEYVKVTFASIMNSSLSTKLVSAYKPGNDPSSFLKERPVGLIAKFKRTSLIGKKNSKSAALYLL